MTADLDCFLSRKPANIDRLDRALKEFGFESGVPNRDVFEHQPRVLMMGRLPFRIDLLNQIDGVTFEDAWSRRVAGHLGDVRVFFISLSDLLINKRASGRAKDLADLESLMGPESSQ